MERWWCPDLWRVWDFTLLANVLAVCQPVSHTQTEDMRLLGQKKKKKLLLTEITNFPDYQWALRKGPSGCQNVNWLTSQEKTSKARKPDLPIMGRVCLLHLGGGYYLYFTGTWHPQYLYLLRLFAIKHLWKDVWKRAYDSSALKMCRNTRNPQRMSFSLQKNTAESRFLCPPVNMRIIKCHWCWSWLIEMERDSVHLRNDLQLFTARLTLPLRINWSDIFIFYIDKQAISLKYLHYKVNCVYVYKNKLLHSHLFFFFPLFSLFSDWDEVNCHYLNHYINFSLNSGSRNEKGSDLFHSIGINIQMM